MLTPDEKMKIIKNSLKSGYNGSIGKMINETEQKALDVDEIARTPSEQEQGLRGKPSGTSMAFPDSTGNFNTKGMSEPINIEKVDKKGNVVRSYNNVPPGIENLPMGDDVGTVIETPGTYQDGGLKNELSEQQPGNKHSGEFKKFLEEMEVRMSKQKHDFYANKADKKIIETAQQAQHAQRGGYKQQFENENTTSYQESQNPIRARASRPDDRQNPDGSVSTHLMAHDPDTLEAWPTLFQNSQTGKWFELHPDMAKTEARLRGEIYKFDSEKEVYDFAVKGNWKKRPELKEHKIFEDTYLKHLNFLKDEAPKKNKKSYVSKQGWGGSKKYQNGGLPKDWIGSLDDGGSLRMGNQNTHRQIIPKEDRTLSSIVVDHFKKNNYNMDHMIQIMDYVGHHETNDNYEQIQVSERDKIIPFDVNEDGEITEGETTTITENYDGPARGRYQFEMKDYKDPTKTAGGMTAINRTMNYFKKDEDFESIPEFENIRNGWRGKLKGQPNSKEIDFTKLSPEEQDFVFIFNYLNGTGKDKKALRELLTQDELPTSDQIFEFWRTNHKRRSEKSTKQEKRGWINRTKDINLEYFPPKEEEIENEIEE